MKIAGLLLGMRYKNIQVNLVQVLCLSLRVVTGMVLSAMEMKELLSMVNI